MKYFRSLTLIAILLTGATLSGCIQRHGAAARLGSLAAPVHLQTQWHSNPLAINTVHPQLGWMLPWTGHGQFQSAYKILVASSRQALAANDGNLWNSGKVISGHSINIRYRGLALTSRQRCFWKVRVWNQNGEKSHWSLVAQWQEGLLTRSRWRDAQWIGEGTNLVPAEQHVRHPPVRANVFNYEMVAPSGWHPVDALPATYLRDQFTAIRRIKRAMVYICGLGYSRLYINGHRIGRAHLSPALSWYPKCAYYRTYNVTRQLQKGTNAIGVILGDGRFYAPRVRRPLPSVSFGPPMLLLRLHIRYTDGTTTNIVTNRSWQMTDNGPLRADDVYDGDIYDTRMAMPGWDTSGFHPGAPLWRRAMMVPGLAKTAVLKAQFNPSIRITDIIHPKKLLEIAPGKWIFDMGQNMVGWCQITVPPAPAGTKIFLRYGESLEQNGKYTVDLTRRGKGRIHLYVANLRSAKQTDELILNGKGSITWHPRFTYHGFRFVELTGYPGTPTLHTIEAMEVVDALPCAGSFACSDHLVNQIFHNCRWGIQNNHNSIPTDCPQRDERQGWMGDRGMESRSESFVFNTERFFDKWLWDIQDAQHPDGNVADVNPPFWPIYSGDVTWPSTFIYLPGTLYLQYGQLHPLRVHYAAMSRWINYQLAKVHHGITTADTFGDWCSPPRSTWNIHSSDPRRATPGPLLATATLYKDLRLMARYAGWLHKPAAHRHWLAEAETLYRGFNRHLWNAAGGYYGNGSDTACLLPLAAGIVPADRRSKVMARLRYRMDQVQHGHVGVGVIGMQWIFNTLTNIDQSDLAWEMLNKTSYPGWGYMVRHGATTIWELWNGNTANPAMNSQDHVMFIGDMLTWLFNDVAGISSDPDDPGFHRIIMKPIIMPGLTWVKASHRSPYGTIVSNWKIKSDGTFQWHVHVPSNSFATVEVPATATNAVHLNGHKIGKKPWIKWVAYIHGRAIYDVESGTYNFSTVPPE